jgi:hypothetical protein
MGRWAERYTREQKTAVGSAMLDPDPLTTKPLTAKQAVKRLNDGSLRLHGEPVPAPAEPMPYTTAYDCRNVERKRRNGTELTPTAKRALEDPAAAGAQLLTRAVSLHERLLAQLILLRASTPPRIPRWA